MIDEGSPFSESVALARLVRRVGQGIQRLMNALVAGVDLDCAGWLGLQLLRIGSAETAADLAVQLEMTSGATTRLLHRLQAQGLIERRKSSVDHRLVMLAVTPRGLRTMKDIDPLITQLWRQLLADFSEIEAEQFSELLNRLLSGMQVRDGEKLSHFS